MNRLESLAEAIKTYEGFYPFSRSWRNNNPGNLRRSKFAIGSSGGFAKFSSFASGWLGLWWDLYCKCTGNTGTALSGESSLLDLFEVWAPRSDANDPFTYANWVANRLGVAIETKLKWFIADV